MKRLFVLTSFVSAGVILWPGCATTKKGCGRKCKTPCNNPCGRAAAPARATADTPPCKTAWKSAVHYGEPMKLSDKEIICSKKVLADPVKYDGQFIRLIGKVASVCPKRGCWLRLGDATGIDTIFVKFTCPMKGRLIPMEAEGKMASVEGTLRATEISQDEARHYKEDAGASPSEIAEIVGPQKIVKMVSRSARIAGLQPAGG
ncbi:MAG: DUF4920 domain-containing protein [Planctomycetota bacterium]|jgi:hypothetical protein